MVLRAGSGAEMEEADLEAINHALSLFHDDERGCHLRTPLFDLEINLRVWAPSTHVTAQSAIRHIHHDLWQVALLASRLEWMRAMAQQKTLDDSIWRAYSQIDIEAFLVQLRSLMDYSVAIIDSFAPKQNQIPQSFRKLRDSIERHGSKLPFGAESIVREAGWFDTIRVMRDALVHDGAEPLVFCDASEGILFQVHTGNTHRFFVRSGFMYNENVVYFDRFAAWSLAHTLRYLDLIGRLLIVESLSGPTIGPSSSYCLGFNELRKWMRNFSQ